MSLETITHKLVEANYFMIIPASQKNTPFPLAEWEIEDEDGKGTGVYYSPQMLDDELGSLLELVPWIDDRFFLMRYGFDLNTADILDWFFLNDDFYDEDGTQIYLTDMRDDGKLLDADEIDYSSLLGVEFGFFPLHMIEDVPEVYTPEPIPEP